MPANSPQRTPELDQVRRLLFPTLPPEEGWARIEGALAGAKDEERIDAIEELAGRRPDRRADRSAQAPAGTGGVGLQPIAGAMCSTIVPSRRAL